jgi:hypothetical protein
VTPLLTRRSLMGTAAGAVAACATSRANAAPQSMLFNVIRGDTMIGTHRLDFTHSDNELVVRVEIALEVEVAWIPVFRYEHTNHEVWRDGRLVHLESRTHDDGTNHVVRAHHDGRTLVVEGDDGLLSVESDMLTTSYWHPETPTRNRLLDTQKGRIKDVFHVSSGIDRMAVASEYLEARRYEASGDLDLTIWYSLQGVWCGLRFDARGEQVNYHPVTFPDPEAWKQITSLIGA